MLAHLKMKKMAHMEVDKAADKVADMVADIVADKVADKKSYININMRDRVKIIK